MKTIKTLNHKDILYIINNWDTKSLQEIASHIGCDYLTVYYAGKRVNKINNKYCRNSKRYNSTKDTLNGIIADVLIDIQ